MKTIILAACVLAACSMGFAAPPVTPQTPAAVEDILLACPFTLEKGFDYRWCEERPNVTSGTLLVLQVDKALVIPRAVPTPVLYVGDITAERVNHGHHSGRVIALVPGDVDLTKAPIWFGAPAYPEGVDAALVMTQRGLAEQAGIKPFSEERVQAALAQGGAPIQSADKSALLRDHVADLIVKYSPEEKHLADDFRRPVITKRRPQTSTDDDDEGGVDLDGPEDGPLGEESRDGDGDPDDDLPDFEGLSVAFTRLSSSITTTQLAGNSLDEYPFFEYVKAFNEDATIELAVDPTQFPQIVGQIGDIYIVEAKGAAAWAADPSLLDVTPGGAQTKFFGGTTIQDNTFTVIGPFELDSAVYVSATNDYTGLGHGYDIVIDVNQNAMLDTGDYIDGLSREAGLYVVHDTTQPGPLDVTVTDPYNVGPIYGIPSSYVNEVLYYPTDIASMEPLPLILVGHGAGHDYTWYDHIGYHMASYGYIVMSHQNCYGPPECTLGHTDAILELQDVIADGAIDGKIDSDRIIWIGHSRGGEGVTWAFDELIEGGYSPTHYTSDGIVLISAMLPIVNPSVDMYHVNFHLWTASGDTDVSGGAGWDLVQTFQLHDRATNFRMSTVVQGTGHAWFHDGPEFPDWFSGECSIGRENTHLVQLGLFLPLIKHYAEGNIPATDFFWRQYERFHPIGVDTSDPCMVVTNEYRNGAEEGNFYIDDFQTEESLSISSSGGAVLFTVQNVTEGQLRDNNSSFNWTASDPFNGATQASASDSSRGVVFDWNNTDAYYEWEVIPAQRNFSDDLYLSFRGAQGTQHPYTLTSLGDLTFSVTLRDGAGTTSSINIGAYGGGLEQPYQRQGGWHNEMEVIRIRLTDFLNNSSGLDLTDIEAVRFDFGPSWGANEGRIVVDELMLTNDAPPQIPGGFKYPKLTLEVNGSTGPVSVVDGTGQLVIEMDFQARDGAGYNAEVYLVLQRASGGRWSYDGSWHNGRNFEYHSGPLMDLNETLGDILGPIVPGDYTAHLILDRTVDGVLNTIFDIDSVDITVLPAGTELILIWDPAGASGQEQADAMAALGYGYELETGALPADLGMYSAVFVDLGIYSGNHVLTSSEGDILAAYIESGGPVYMEGGDTWAYDTQTAAHGYFGINGLSDGSADTFSCTGVAGTFTDGMDFTYAGDNSWMDQLAAVSPAYSIFTEGTAGYVNGVFGPTYGTVGCSYDFGGLVDGASPSTKVELMAYYLSFMGL